MKIYQAGVEVASIDGLLSEKSHEATSNSPGEPLPNGCPGIGLHGSIKNCKKPVEGNVICRNFCSMGTRR